MNLSYFELESESPEHSEESLTRLREQESKVIRKLEAIEGILGSQHWSSLKEDFEEEIARLERLHAAEAKRKELNIPELYRSQGRIEEARRLGLIGMLEQYRYDLKNIRSKIPPDGAGNGS